MHRSFLQATSSFRFYFFLLLVWVWRKTTEVILKNLPGQQRRSNYQVVAGVVCSRALCSLIWEQPRTPSWEELSSPVPDRMGNFRGKLRYKSSFSFCFRGAQIWFAESYLLSESFFFSHSAQWAVSQPFISFQGNVSWVVLHCLGLPAYHSEFMALALVALICLLES